MAAKKGLTQAQKKREQEQRELTIVMNRCRENREKSLKLVPLIREDPRKAEKVKKDMIADLVGVFETRHAMLGNSAGRDRYRSIGNYSEVLVRFLFGTHARFKQEAELADTPVMRKGATRAAKLAQAQDIARYAEENILDYADRFEFKGAKGNDGQVHMIVSSDHHSKKVDLFAMRVLTDVLAWVQPDYNVFNGDVQEFSDFSSHRHMPGHFDMNAQEEVDYASEKILVPCVAAAPGAEHIYTMGNHDWRLAAYMADRASALACFRTNNFVDLLNLRDLDIALVCRSNFLAPTSKMRKKDINENFMIAEEACVVTHGMYTGPSACTAHVKRFQMTGINGHEHGPHYQSFNSISTGPIGWYVAPMMAGHAVGRDYVSLPSQWQMGFAHITICKRTKHVQVNLILVNETATFAGRTWKITKAEKAARIKAWEV